MIETNTDSMDVIIRPMINEDVISYCSLFQGVFSHEPWNEKWTIRQIDTLITRQMGKKGFWGTVASAQNCAIGYLTGFRLWLFPSIFYLDQLFVSTEYQGLKIGKRLLDETEQHLKDQGVSHIILLTKPQSHAEKFYLNNRYKTFLRTIQIKGKCFYCKEL